MNKANITKWVEALESGNYNQGSGSLHRGNSFCCLGVACDIAKADLGYEWIIDNEDGARYPSDSELRYHAVAPGETKKDLNYWMGSCMPPAVTDWLGIKDGNPELNGMHRCIYLNDREQRSFTEIATLIRKTFLQ